MVKFAVDCVSTMHRLTMQLEEELGPETADLRLRVGLHSGPVLAGVLRGEKSRFQLFGDTVNIASRMDSTGLPNKIQISQDTADRLEEAGKPHWFEPRAEKITADGKGTLNTYFLRVRNDGKRPLRSGSVGSFAWDGTSNTSDTSMLGVFRDDEERLEKRDRVADWTVVVLEGLLKEIAVRRVAAQIRQSAEPLLCRLETGSSVHHDKGHTVISELAEIVELPKFDATAAEREALLEHGDVDLPAHVFEELRVFVRTIASMYRDNRTCRQVF